MIRLLAYATILNLLGSAAAAAPIRVKSGEHPDFTRFVFYLLPGVDASVRERQNRVSVLVPGETEFDLTGLFDRIPRDRVSAAEQGPGTIDLLLGCNCGIRTFRMGDNMLVLDVLDALPGSVPPRRPFRFWSLATLDPEGTVAPRLSFPTGPRGSDTLQRRPERVEATRVAPPEDVTPLSPVQQALIRQTRGREAETRLAQQLARATTQGLLNLDRSVSKPLDRSFPASAASAAPPVQNPAESPPNLEATTSIDVAAQRPAPSAPVDAQGDACPADAALDLPRWGGSAAFGPELGRRRARLYNDLDVTDTEARESLARFYLGYGFGAEAAQVLSALPAEDFSTRMLMSMARILTTGHEPPPGAFHGMADCDSGAALWAVMSYRSLPPGLTIERGALLRGFGALPPDLRRHLGPDLATRLTDFGDPDLAASVLQLVKRGNPEGGPAEDYAEARLAASEGRTAEAAERLDALVETNAPPSPAALAMLIDTRMADGDTLDPDLVALAEAYATELRASSEGPMAERAAILALAAAGRHREALDRLGPQDEDAPGDWADTRSRIAALIARDADDARFLALAGRLAAEAPDTLAAGPGNAVAQRLHALGFGDLALTVLSGPARGDLNRDRRMIRARIAIDSRRPRRAEAEVLGLQGPDADRIRAEAAALRGDHAEAARAFEALEETGRATREAWRAGDWARVQSAQDGALSAAAALASETATPADPGMPDEAGVLARNRALLDRSSAARETLDRLLRELGSDGDAG